MRDEPWDAQNKLKYEHHDLPFADLVIDDFYAIRSLAHQKFTRTNETDNVKLIVDAFVDLLTKKGYRIVKEKK